MSTPFDRDARMALAIKVQVARFRSDDAEARYAEFRPKIELLMEAMDPATSPQRKREIWEAPDGPGRMRRDEVQRALALAEERHACAGVAVEAVDALTAAWEPGDGDTMLQWVG